MYSADQRPMNDANKHYSITKLNLLKLKYEAGEAGYHIKYSLLENLGIEGDIKNLMQKCAKYFESTINESNIDKPRP